MVIVDASLIPLLAAMTTQDRRDVIVVGESDTHRLGETLSYEELIAAEEPGFEWPDLDERGRGDVLHERHHRQSQGRRLQPPLDVAARHRRQAASSVGMTETDRVLVIVPMFHANAWGMPYGACWPAPT